MKVLFVVIAVLFVSAGLSPGQDVTDFALLAQACAPEVHNQTLTALVSVESGFNPYAIGVVDGRLSRQPKNLTEALDVVGQLEGRGMNYSLGIAQVNKYNLSRHGLSPAVAFDPCRSLMAGSRILTDCYQQARKTHVDEQQAVRAALSCYYSGNFTTGFKDGYVQKVVARAGQTAAPNLNSIKIIKHDTQTRRNGNNHMREAPLKETRRERDPAFVF
ncbi:MAG: Type IV secretion system protein virB1 [Syntrophorhabdaceae bacterium PtaU1.Bin034]|jgi:type IV secretion system protein VirB1|nr:MAG: Type IV secretion system protein virB1 [Syntrophorhabdaceae bacterium PtaU1.Bin034]